MIRIHGLRVDLPGFQLGEVSLNVGQGEFFALMGPTGSGKTLLLESIAGLIRATAGNIVVDGLDVTDLAPEKRRVGLVYQDNALFPHMTVLDNITYGRQYHGMDKAQGLKAAHELMDILGLSRLAGRKPETLSGGEKQRTALARALICKPSVLLLDEPLSSLDPQFREDVRRTLADLHTSAGTTFLMVTHDFVDALTLADRAAVIRNGRLEQVGEVRDIFHRPATAFTARFVGMKNVFPAMYERGECHFASIRMAIPNGGPVQGRGYAALRPEDVMVSLNGDSPDNLVHLPGVVQRIFRTGFSWAAEVSCGENTFTARMGHDQALDSNVQPGAEVMLCFDPSKLHHILEMKG